MGGKRWCVRIVPPSSPLLVDRTGRRTVAVTDPSTHIISVSSAISGDFLKRVLAHELTHAAMESHGINRAIRGMVPPGGVVPVQEMASNVVADYGARIVGESERLHFEMGG